MKTLPPLCVEITKGVNMVVMPNVGAHCEAEKSFRKDDAFINAFLDAFLALNARVSVDDIVTGAGKLLSDGVTRQHIWRSSAPRVYTRKVLGNKVDAGQLSTGRDKKWYYKSQQPTQVGLPFTATQKKEPREGIPEELNEIADSVLEKVLANHQFYPDGEIPKSEICHYDSIKREWRSACLSRGVNPYGPYAEGHLDNRIARAWDNCLIKEYSRKDNESVTNVKVADTERIYLRADYNLEHKVLPLGEFGWLETRPMAYHIPRSSKINRRSQANEKPGETCTLPKGLHDPFPEEEVPAVPGLTTQDKE